MSDMNFLLKACGILLLSFSFIQVNGEEADCESACFEDDQSTACNVWNNTDGEDKRISKTVYQFDPKTQKCIQLSCKDDSLSGLVASESKCLENCGNCGRVLKHYKYDDECLKPTVMEPGYDLKGGKPVMEDLNIYTFDIQEGKCSLKYMYSESNWYASKGVGLPSKAECKKRCPSIKSFEETQ